MFTWRLKWWQSGLLGVVIGLAVFNYQCNVARQHVAAWSRKSFFEVCLTKRSGGPSPFSDIVITPQFDGTYTVTCLCYSNPDFPSPQKLQFEILPGRDANASGSMGVILSQSLIAGDDFMSMMHEYARQCYWLRYEYQWWREPRLLIWIYPLLGAFFLGIVIPFLRFAWTGGALPDSQKPYDLNRFAGASNEATPNPTEMTTEQSQQLGTAIAAAQQASAAPPDSGAIPGPVPHEAPVRKLDSKPLAEPSPAATQSEKDFDGEFYPTEIHHHDSKPKPE